MQLTPIEFPTHTRLVFGAGVAAQVGPLAQELGAQKILLVTDAGIVAAGHAGRVIASLEAAGLRVTVFDQAKENPTTKCVAECVAVAWEAGVDFLIGLGGGSSMDTAKGCNFILTNGGQMKDYWGVGKATKPMLPFIAIPTTAGTGSEMQCAALIADEITHQKMACLDPKCAARVAILDPELTISQPPRVTACTGIDAIAHAVETAVTTKRNELSQKLSTEAFKLCLNAFPLVMQSPENLVARAQMQREDPAILDLEALQDVRFRFTGRADHEEAVDSFDAVPLGFAHGVFRTAALLRHAVEKRQPSRLKLGDD